MRVHHSFEGTKIRNSVITTGSFDGVHVGHRVILDRLVKKAGEIGGQSVLITFYPHPRKVLYPQTQGRDLRMINSQEEKVQLLQQSKLDHLLILPFNIEFSRITSLDFVRMILVRHLDVRQVVVGFNHFFGYNREGDFTLLREMGAFYGFGVEEIPEQDIQHETVSSTKIRKALTEGNIQRANAYLDHPYFIKGSVSSMIHNTLPVLAELEISDPDKLIPPPGAYAIATIAEGGKRHGVAYVIEKGPGRQVLFTWKELAVISGQVIDMQFFKAINQGGNPELHITEKQIRKDLEKVQELIY